MKKLFYLPILILCLLLFPVTAHAETTEDGFSYEILSDSTIKITWYNGSDSHITIPSIIDEKPVTQIGSQAFSSKTQLISVTIPENITTIGFNAFWGCTSLETVTIEGNGLQMLDGQTFHKCSSLKKINFPESLTTITNYIFDGTSKIESIGPLGSGCDLEFGWTTQIPDYAFSYLNLKEIQLPETIEHIGKSAFTRCSGLELFSFPSSIKSIGSSAFSSTTGFVDVILPETITEFGSSVFDGCKTLKSVTLPSSLSSIPAYCFARCNNLTSITHGPNLTHIGRQAFDSCTSLKNFIIPEGVSYIDEFAFYDCINLEYIRLPKSLTKIKSSAFRGCTLLGTVGPLNSNSAIEYCWDSTIPENIFQYCETIKTVQLSDSISSIGDYAFADCPNLKEISNSEALTAIGNYAFSSCKALEKITLTDNIVSIGEYAFSGCQLLKEIHFPSQLTSVPNGLFKDCTSLSSISLENTSITRIGSEAFRNCAQIKKVVIPEEVQEVGASAFKDCVNLNKMTFLGNGDNLTLDNYYIEGCSKLLVAGPIGHDYNLEFAWNNQIPDKAFLCSSLNEIYVTDGATHIGSSAFSNSANLSSVYIPNSVTKIGSRAFYFCDALTEIIYKGNINEWYSLVENSYDCSLEYTNATAYMLNPFIDVNGDVFYYDPVIWAYLYDITTGTDDTHFSPVATCTRGQAVTFLWRIFGEEEPTISNPFVDINPNAFYYKAVLWAYENGITTGMDATHFNPEGLLSRNEFVTFLWRTQDKPQPNVENPFVDVPANMYFTDAVLWAYENGITTGMDAAHFAPQELCSRAHIVTFLYRAFAEE